ncbi:hypothetical protein O9H85_11455 [Paenibacillus filicis]|uniref:Uncharacterized protein n=1 Tax=Paenibacillus gyeongsangnamensis TaxID=3388067 RepID=A0ABT4Q828_9BACL|nr:hypothetical protein [Paenibacillus filicis]MCZ8513027.1 hypothetical protein [Paenibacillus filicis]
MIHADFIAGETHHQHGGGTVVSDADTASGSHAMTGTTHEAGQIPLQKTVLTGSLLLVAVIVIYLVVRIRRSTFEHATMAGMMAAMAIGMMAGLVIGVIVGILTMSLFVGTVIAVAIGMASGFAAGQHQGMLASMEGLLAGLMGGMMGAMTGVMLHGEHPVLTVLFMDLIFAVLLYPLTALISPNRRRTEA